MRTTKGWKKENKYEYRNRNNKDIKARVVKNPEYRNNKTTEKWVAQIVKDTFSGYYALKRRHFSSKQVARDYLLDYIDKNPYPQLKCPKCNSTEIRTGSKSSSRGMKKVWWDCDECEYEGTPKHTIQ